MSATRPFRYAVVDNETKAAGVVMALSLPSDERLRYVWVFYQRALYSDILPTNLECWVRFYSSGEMVLEIPAALVPVSASRLGIAGYQLALNTQNSTGVSGPDVLWWNTSDGTNVQNPVHPFRLLIQADEIKLEHNQSLAIRAMLAVLSMRAPT